MEQEPNLDKGKKIAQQIDEEDEMVLKRDRFENKVIAEPSDEEADIFVKKARIEAPLSITLYHASMPGHCNQPCSSRCRGSHIGKGNCRSSGELPDKESLRDQINSIVRLHGLDGVPLDAAAVLNNGLDEYINRIIRPCINLVHPGSYQIRMHDSEVPVQMNEQWLEQLGDMSNPTRNTLNEFFPNPATIGWSTASGLSGNTGIDLNQEPISGWNSLSLSSGTDGTGTSHMEIDLNRSLDVDIDLNLSPNAVPVLPVAGMSGLSLAQGPVPFLIPPWAPNLTSAGSAADISVGMDMASNLGSIGGGSAARMDGDIPDYLSRIGSDAATSTEPDMPEILAFSGRGSGTDTSTGSIFFIDSSEQGSIETVANQIEFCLGSDVATSVGWNAPEHLPYAGQSSGVRTGTGSIFFIGSLGQGDNESMENEMEWYIGNEMEWSQNLVSAGRNADTNTVTHSIFLIGSPEQHDTESTENQMEWAENINGIPHTGVGFADTLSGVDNLNEAGRIHRTVTFQDLQLAMAMNPQVLGTNLPVMLEDLLSHSPKE